MLIVSQCANQEPVHPIWATLQLHAKLFCQGVRRFNDFEIPISIIARSHAGIDFQHDLSIYLSVCLSVYLSIYLNLIQSNLI